MTKLKLWAKSFMTVIYCYISHNYLFCIVIISHFYHNLLIMTVSHNLDFFHNYDLVSQFQHFMSWLTHNFDSWFFKIIKVEIMRSQAWQKSLNFNLCSIISFYWISSYNFGLCHDWLYCIIFTFVIILIYDNLIISTFYQIYDSILTFYVIVDFLSHNFDSLLFFFWDHSI